MNKVLIKWQLGFCAGLSVLLLAEFAYGELARRSIRDALNRTQAVRYRADPLPRMAADESSAVNPAALSERPLFIEGRRPLADSAAEQTDSDAVGQLDDWELIGIYQKSKRLFALFRKKEQKKQFLKLTEAQTIAGWQIERIDADRVILSQGGLHKTVVLRKPRPKNKAPVPEYKTEPPKLIPTAP